MWHVKMSKNIHFCCTTLNSTIYCCTIILKEYKIVVLKNISFKIIIMKSMSLAYYRPIRSPKIKLYLYLMPQWCIFSKLSPLGPGPQSTSLNSGTGESGFKHFICPGKMLRNEQKQPPKHLWTIWTSPYLHKFGQNPLDQVWIKQNLPYV